MNTILKKILSTGSILPLIFLLTGLLSSAQDSKLPLTVEDYAKWSHTFLGELSADGSWCSYTLSYENGMDTLFVKNIRNHKSFAFPASANGTFAKNTFSALGQDKVLRTLLLKSGKIVETKGIRQFEYGLNDFRVIGMTDDSAIVVLNEQAKEIFRRDNVLRFEISPQKDKLAFWVYENEKSIFYCLDLSSLQITQIHEETGKNIGGVRWSENGEKLLSTAQDQEANRLTALLYDIEKNKKTLLDDIIKKEYSNWEFQVVHMDFSLDGTKVHVQLYPPADSIEKPERAEIWNGNDKRLYPLRAHDQPGKKPESLFEWTLASGSFRMISTGNNSYYSLSRDGKYLLEWDKFAREPQSNKEADRDIYLRNLQSGVTSLLVNKISGADLMLLQSPKGSFVTWYKDGEWYLYSYKHNRTTALGTLLKTSVSIPLYEVLDELRPVDLLYFSEDEKYVFMRDEYDIWKIEAATLKYNRLTFGREKGIKYEFAATAQKLVPFKYSGYYTRVINTDNPIILGMLNTESLDSGYCTIDLKGKLTEIVYGPHRYTQLRRAATGALFYVKEDFYNPPLIEHKNLAGKKADVLFISNPQHGQYAWGSVEKIEYFRSNGKRLKALVYYPPNFDKNKKYPMIVYIYENLSRGLHNYLVPSVSNSIGYNIPDLLAQGYIVFQPDTESDKGNPGPANVDCVVNAVKTIVAKGNVDPERIGLYGHSHGGYKTFYIISQTDIFKAAIAGDGITNMFTDYLSVSLYDIPLYWRYEHHQLRMGEELFGNVQHYIDNSAIYHADKIKTPLLSWSGKEDYHVLKEQTTQMYFALRRLGREHIMLLYPKEGHSLGDRENQEDLRNKIVDWFGYYLKGESKNEWMQPKQ
ncbi:MAG: hypothetical protein DI539_15125 [Flavobacterium psychrophilum]|nr:MAG: hypothetical protein DI539_15125 [Flavobacterium psychrophilum]